MSNSKNDTFRNGRDVELYLLTNSCLGIPQRSHETESLDVGYISEKIGSFNINTRVIEFKEFMDAHADCCSGKYFFYASSQYEKYKSYIDDILYKIADSGGILIPKYSIFRSHENKFYQELTKRELGIESPGVCLVGSLEEIKQEKINLDFPFIAKLPNGYASRAVFKVESIEDLLKVYMKYAEKVIPRRLNIFKRNRQILFYKNKYPLHVGKIVLQEMINGVDHDWKVLVFDNYFFTLKRYVKKNDFKASGSGLFDFDARCPDHVLDFAKKCHELLGSPWLSLDIIDAKNRAFLIEYQGVHFGPLALLNNKNYYEYVASEWIRKEKENNLRLEDYFINSIVKVIRYDSEKNSY